MNKKDKKDHWIIYVRYFSFALSFGVTMILAILLGLFGGRWLDRQLSTDPIFMLLGIFFGIAAGFYRLWSELSILQQEGRLNKKTITKKINKRDEIQKNDAEQE